MFRDGADGHDVMIGTQPDVQLVANLKLLRALGALPVYFDFAGLDGGRGKRPRFEETRCPQPFVEPDPRNLV